MQRLLAYCALARAAHPDIWDGLDSILPETDYMIEGGDDDYSAAASANKIESHTTVGDSALSRIVDSYAGPHWAPDSTAFIHGAGSDSLSSEAVDFSPDSAASIEYDNRGDGLALPATTDILPTNHGSADSIEAYDHVDYDDVDYDDVDEVNDAEAGDGDEVSTDLGSDYIGDAGEERSVSVVPRGGPAAARKRLRASDSAPRKRTARGEVLGEVKVIGLSYQDKKICLEEMVLSPRDRPEQLFERVLKRNPTIDFLAVRNFRANVLATAQLPETVHALLMSGQSGTQEKTRLIEQATRALAAISGKGRGMPARRVADWMRFCIEPLHNHTGPESDIFDRLNAKSGRGERLVRLAEGQLKLFLEAELESLQLRPIRKQRVKHVRSRPKKRVTTHSASAVPKPLTVQAGHPARIQQGGLSDEEKRVFLEIVIERPGLHPYEVRERVQSRIPQVDVKSVGIYNSNLRMMTRVSGYVHYYLLSRNATDYHHSMVADLDAIASEKGVSVPRGGHRKVVEIWIKYCIRPLLSAADHVAAIPPCGPDPTARDKTGVYLSPSQQKALYNDILDSMDDSPVIGSGSERVPTKVDSVALDGSVPHFGELPKVDSVVVEPTSRSEREDEQRLVGELIASTTTAVPPPVRIPVNARKAEAHRPHHRGNDPSRGMSLAERRICLKLLIEEPEISNREFVERIASRLPHIEKNKVMNVYHNAVARTRVPSLLHDYLLTQGQLSPSLTRYSIVRMATQALAGKLPAMRGTVRNLAKMWMEHCIEPILANHELPQSSFCRRSTDTRERDTYHLAAAGRRAVFMALLASL